jgi:hypothetical protein
LNNEYFDIVEDSAGRHSTWARAFRLAAAFEPGTSNQALFKVRGRAALTLYRETAVLMQAVISAHHREVIDKTLALIEKTGF